ncbi:MAG: MFS transporter [Rhodocyclaceae bacterium]
MSAALPASSPPRAMLLRTGLFAAMLATAGLPIYIHLPRFAGNELGLPLGTLGALLIALRLFDLVQDPFLGRLVDRFPRARGAFAALASLGLAAGFLMLFSLAPPVAPALWLVLALVPLFTAFSLATILLYGQGVSLAKDAGGHFGIAGARETGLLAGVIVAAAAPAALAAFVGAGRAYPVFGILLAALALGTWVATRPLWRPSRIPLRPLSLANLRSSGAGRLLLLAMLNATPVALTSTLFLFFVEDRLELASLAGPFLILFFAAAGAAAPGWSLLARRIGPRRSLLSGMSLAVLAFAGAALLGPGDAAAFALISAASGAALGADMVILPALFAAALDRAGLPAGQAFGLWALASKLALALAAALALPLLELRGYIPGAENTVTALATLGFAYAVLPCVLKLGVITLVIFQPLPGART